MLTSALASTERPEPISAAIEEAAAKVEDICGEGISELFKKRIVRALVLHDLYGRAGGEAPKGLQGAYEEAMSDLGNVVAGKVERRRTAIVERTRRCSRQDQEGQDASRNQESLVA